MSVQTFVSNSKESLYQAGHLKLPFSMRKHILKHLLSDKKKVFQIQTFQEEK